MELRVEEKVVGRVTSAVFSARTTSNIGLAMIKRGYNDIGTSLLASNGKVQTNVRVVALPVKSGSADPSGDAEGRGEVGLLA
jgi:glycine cleavage system aminomethyltransferase T